MVRFKPHRHGPTRCRSRGFNSTMVRFKLDQKQSLLPSSSWFQFHDGSIQALGILQCLQWIQVVSIPRWFDSSLKASRHSGSVYLRFNSTMVRFKPQPAPGGCARGPEFQFHDGSIQAQRQSAILPRYYVVSIPRWFDSSTVASVGGNTAAKFQFHDGSIQALLNAQALL